MSARHGSRLLAFAVLASLATAACEALTIAPGVSPSSARCAVEVTFDEGDPNGLVSGTGFQPDEPATLTMAGPPDPASPLVLTQADDAGLRADVRGIVRYRLVPGRENIGPARITLAAGGCTATTDIVLDASGFPPACPETPPPPAGARSAAYEALILADEPLAYWRFEDEVDSPLAMGEVGLPGAVLGNAVLGRAGVGGSRALGLRGDGRVAIDPLDLAGDFTIEGWLLLCDDGIDAGDGLFAATGGAPNVNFFDAAPRFWTGDEDLVFAEAGFATHLRWYHLAVVRDEGAISLVVDGVSFGSAAFAEPLTIAFLGDSGGGSTSGQLDELAVYDHALGLEALAARIAAAR